jgi:hypothetical protein
MSKLTLTALLALSFATAAAPAFAAEATVDDTAKFLAGMPPSPDSPLAPLTKNAAWQEHAHYLDGIFAREEAVHLSKIRAFSQENLTEKHETMLYMFSGPDFLYATSFFPGASTYVLAGLEPPGDIPQIEGLPRSSVDRALSNLHTSMGSLLSLSFFITKNMKTQLAEGPFYGTLPVLYVFMERTGKTVKEVTLVNLEPDGTVQTREAHKGRNLGARAEGASSNGVKIVFSAGKGPDQTLYYFSTNIADDSIRRTGLLPFVDKLGTADAFIKSASYLLHSGSFQTVRNMLLTRSATILEDDSGIPLSYFDPKKWRLQPVGHYVGPIGVFSHNYQGNMAELFRKEKPIPIDFGIGYRFRKNESSLLLARKIAPATSQAETPAHKSAVQEPVAQKPVAQEPAAPAPAAPASAAQGPAAPAAAAQEAAAPASTAPASTAPASAAPEPAAHQSAAQEPAAPESAAR